MAGGLRANPPLADGSLHLTVANPSQTWQANRPLSLGESVQLSVTAEPAGRTSQQAPLLHLQSLRITPSSLTKTIWIPVGPASIRALHLGQYENTFTAEISAVWVEQQAAGPGGGGGLSQLASQYGTARGTATSKNPSFSWTAVQPRHQFPDGSSSIQFAANGESNITGVILSDSGYKVSTALGTLHGGSLNSAGGFAGELSSTAAGSTRLSITWTGQGVAKELSRSPELAFSNLDMKPKAGPGATQVLAEDRVKPTISPENPASNPDGHHEIDPGTFAFLLPSTATNVTRTEVTIVKQFSQTTPARAKLESHGLPSLVVSTDAEGNAPLSLPADWPNANAIPSTIYLHGTTDAQNPPPQKGTLALTLELELQDDAQTAPFSDQPSTQKSWHKIVEKIGVSLLPVELWDINDHANTGDDVVISNWTTGQTITDASIAWIEAHKSATDDTPRMPQLVFNIPGFPQGVTLEAKLLIEYERPYTGKQADDTVKIPASGSFKTITNGRWEIWDEYKDLPFFGGDATLTFKINGGAEQTIKFAIGGRNPDDSRCKAYTQGRPGSPWYAYAIEKSESQAYNAGFYNQFWERSGNSTPVNPGAVNYVFTKGDPLVIRTPPETGVGGAGLAQVTGAGGVKTVSAPREIFWNWQKNVDAFLNILAGKVAEAESAMNNPNPRNPPNPRPDGQRHQSRFDTGNFVSVPLIFNGVDKGTQGRIKFSDNSKHKRPEDAVAIKRYNGAQADWCSWAGISVSDTANHHWQWNYGANNYVAKVSDQVEEQQP